MSREEESRKKDTRTLEGPVRTGVKSLIALESSNKLLSLPNEAFHEIPVEVDGKVERVKVIFIYPDLEPTTPAASIQEALVAVKKKSSQGPGEVVELSLFRPAARRAKDNPSKILDRGLFKVDEESLLRDDQLHYLVATPDMDSLTMSPRPPEGMLCGLTEDYYSKRLTEIANTHLLAQLGLVDAF